MTVIIGLDLSLTSTGLARIEAGQDALGATVLTQTVTSKPRARRRGDPPPLLLERSARLRRLAGDITQRCASADLVVIEGPAFSRNESGTWDRAGLWWLVVARLTGAGLRVVEADPTKIKTYALGKGAGQGTDKDHVLAAVVKRYPDVDVTGNDVADALVLAALGARFAGFPIEPHGLPQTHLKALDGIRWTTN
jgi:crossover junction endodeoxyribonuclease RuvC